MPKVPQSTHQVFSRDNQSFTNVNGNLRLVGVGADIICGISRSAPTKEEIQGRGKESADEGRLVGEVFERKSSWEV